MTPLSTEDEQIRRVTSFRRPVAVGAAAVALFVGTLSAWAFGVPLSAAVIASGRVVTDESIQIVRHERGGVLESLAVHEGDAVRRGAVLAVLGRVEAAAAEGELKTRLASLAARRIRLEAELAGAPRLALAARDLPVEVRSLDASVLANLIADQHAQFDHRRVQFDNSLAILVAQKNALDEQLPGAEGELASLWSQSRSVETDVALRRAAIAKGLGREAALREMERQLDGLRGSIAKAKAAIAVLAQQREECVRRIAGQRSDFVEKASGELAAARAEALEAWNALAGKTEAVSRVEIRAPVSGVVNRVRVSTLGSAVEPFAPLFEIVPEGQPLLIEIRVAPGDIDQVTPRQQAYVVLTAFNRREFDPVSARVERVAADAERDEATQQPYYVVRLGVDETARKGLPPIIPGMPAEAYLVTQERTFAQYVAEPFVQSFRRAFKQ